MNNIPRAVPQVGEGCSIVLPDSTDLDWAQITYALNDERLIFVNNYKIWSKFSAESGSEYNDYTPEELGYRFLQRILPNIYMYELNEHELHLLNLLDLHPDFIRIENGFSMKPVENLTFPANEAAIGTLTSHCDSYSETSFVGGNAVSNPQIQIVNFGARNSADHKFSFNTENVTLLSVVLCSDENLPNSELLTTEDIHKRLKFAKHQFENNGRQLENIKISLDDLLNKINTLKKLKTAVAQLIDKSLKNNQQLKLPN